MEYEKLFWAAAGAALVFFFAIAAAGIASKPVAGENAYIAQQIRNDGGTLQYGGQLAKAENGVQVVQLKVIGAEYAPNPIRVKKGIPVRLVADLNSVQGCARGIVIPEFGIEKNLAPNDSIIEFVPDKSGTFAFSCFMGMYRGTIVVEEEDGTVANYSGTSALPQGRQGGCGCGGCRVRI
jgi:hypothetical protein